jgi:NADPH:quinone reductase-like Zn-dependent oxidoreductase
MLDTIKNMLPKKSSKSSNTTTVAPDAAAAAEPQTAAKPSATMQAVRLGKASMQNPGGEGAALETVPIPEPKAGEYLLQMKLRPVNPADVFTFMGIYPGSAPQSEWPMTPGLDGTGIVTKTGPGSSKFSVGQRVSVAGVPAEHGNGSWAEYVSLPEDDLVAVPDSVSDVEAAQFWVNPMAVYGMLTGLNLKEGDYVIFAAAGSALCRMGISLAKHLGLKSIGTVRRDEQREEVLAHGADYCISTASEDVVKRVKEITGGQGASGALDSIGGDNTGVLVSSLRPGGKVWIYGAMGGTEMKLPLMDMLFHTITVSGFWLTPYSKNMSKADRAKTIETVMQLIADKVLQPGSFAGTTYPLAEFAQAIAESNKPGRGGKVFLSS